MKRAIQLIFVAIGSLYATASYGQGSISPHNSHACIETFVQFSVSGSSATSGYTWTIDNGNGWIDSGQGTKNVVIWFSMYGPCVVRVSGNGLSASTTVRVDVPTAGQVISGLSTVCPGTSSVFTATDPYGFHVTSYYWSAPNATIVSQQDNSVTISFPSNSTSSQISVEGVNSCGITPATSKTVALDMASCGSILPANPTVCGETDVQFTVSGSSATSGYSWTIDDSRGSVMSGQGTNTASMLFTVLMVPDSTPPGILNWKHLNHPWRVH